MQKWRRRIPLLILAGAAIAVVASGAYEQLSFAALQAREAQLRQWASAAPFAAGAAFVLVYIGAAALAVPGAIWLTLAGGLVFGVFWGGLLTLLGATLGASILFLAARTAFGDWMQARAPARLQAVQAGFQNNAASWMLIVRLVPLFPFFLVNLAAALGGVPLRVFVWTSLVGMAPACFIYASIGNGLGELLRLNEPPNLGLFTRPELILPLIGLAALASLPMVWRYWQNRKVSKS